LVSFPHVSEIKNSILGIVIQKTKFWLRFILILKMCKCGRGLDASSTHLTCCSFKGQHITTHDVITNMMYAFIRKSEHIVLREWWYAFTSGVSLEVNVYMNCEDQVFVTNVVVTDVTWETMVASVINRPVGVVTKLAPLLRSASIESFMRGITLFQWPWRCTTHPNVIWIISLGNVVIFSMIDNQEVICPCLFTFYFSCNMLVLFFSVFYPLL
jgi:hypothetical protein